MGKKILALLAGICVIVIAVVIGKDYKENQELEEVLRECEEEAAPLEKELRGIEVEMDKLTMQLADASMEHGTFTLVFTDLDALVAEEIWPDVQNYQMTGMLMLSEEQLPGLDGMITMPMFQEIIESGWEYCLEWNGEEELENWLEDRKEQLEEQNIAFPQTLSFREGTYREEYDEILKEYGITCAIYHGEGVTHSAVIDMNEQSLWRLQTYPFHIEDGKLIAENAVSSGKSISFTIGNRTKAEQYQRESMNTLLEYLKKWEEKDGLKIITAKEARKYQQEQYQQRKEQNLGLEEQYNQLEDQRQKLQKTIDAIYEKYWQTAGR